MESFAQLLARAERTGSSADVIALLRQARTHRVPATHNATVLKWGAHALSKCRAALGDELWSVYEQTLLAALAAHDDALADACAEALDARFGDSTRVKRLLAMRDEARGDFADADEVYGSLLDANPANALVFKRRVAVLRAKGQLAASAKLLNEYVGIFSSDEGAWQQLAELHLKAARYEAAAFCYEELVLMQPTSHLYHCRLAELYATIGPRQLLAARKHFAQSLDLKRAGNARALHGLCGACAAIADRAAKDRKLTPTEADVETNAALHAWAVAALQRLYTDVAPPALLQVLTATQEAQAL